MVMAGPASEIAARVHVPEKADIPAALPQFTSGSEREAHMKLNVIERIHLLGILPAEGDFTTLRILRDLRAALSFTEQEHKDLGITVIPRPDGQQNITWNQAADTGKEIEIGPRARTIIEATLDGLEKGKRLPATHLELYERFMEPAKSGEITGVQ